MGVVYRCGQWKTSHLLVFWTVFSINSKQKQTKPVFLNSLMAIVARYGIVWSLPKPNPVTLAWQNSCHSNATTIVWRLNAHGRPTIYSDFRWTGCLPCAKRVIGHGWLWVWQWPSAYIYRLEFYIECTYAFASQVKYKKQGFVIALKVWCL